MMRIATATIIAQPADGLIKKGTENYLRNGGHIYGKYIWTCANTTICNGDTKELTTIEPNELLGVAVSADITENGKYIVCYLPMLTPEIKFYVMAELINNSI